MISLQNAFEPSSRAAARRRAEAADPGVGERIGDPGHQRRLRADDDEVGLHLPGGADDGAGVGRDPAAGRAACAAMPTLPGAHTTSGALR